MDRPPRDNTESTNLFDPSRNDIPVRQEHDSLSDARMSRPVRQSRHHQESYVDLDCGCDNTRRGGININNSTVYIINGDRPTIAGRLPSGYAPYADEQMYDYRQNMYYDRTRQALDYSRMQQEHEYQVRERLGYSSYPQRYGYDPYAEYPQRRLSAVSARDYDAGYYDDRNQVQRGFDNLGNTLGSVARALLPALAIGAEVSMFRGMSHGGWGQNWGGNWGGNNYMAYSMLSPLAYRQTSYMPYYGQQRMVYAGSPGYYEDPYYGNGYYS